MNVSRQIGWSNESNLLYQILKQLNKLGSVLSSLVSSATPKYKVYTALLTQTGGDSLQTISGGDLTMGVTYMIKDVGGDFTNVGAPNNNINTYFVATATTPNDWGGNTLEFNTGAPVVKVLENTIGGVWFTYINPGVYYINSNTAFINQEKIAAFLAFPGNTFTGGWAAVYVNQGPYNLAIESGGYDITTKDSILYDTSIEIRVYN